MEQNVDKLRNNLFDLKKIKIKNKKEKKRKRNNLFEPTLRQSTVF